MIGTTHADKTQATKTKKLLLPQVLLVPLSQSFRPRFKKTTIGMIVKPN